MIGSFIDNSTLPGKAWLEHALPLIAEQLRVAVLRYLFARWRNADLGWLLAKLQFSFAGISVAVALSVRCRD